MNEIDIPSVAIRRSGSGLGIQIPSAVVNAYQIRQGDYYAIRLIPVRRRDDE